MITLLFCVLMIAFIAEVIGLAIRLAWSLTKVIFTIAGALIMGAVLLSGGFVAVAFTILILAGIGGIVTAIAS